jgi:hypothetical protein
MKEIGRNTCFRSDCALPSFAGSSINDSRSGTDWRHAKSPVLFSHSVPHTTGFSVQTYPEYIFFLEKQLLLDIIYPSLVAVAVSASKGTPSNSLRISAILQVRGTKSNPQCEIHCDHLYSRHHSGLNFAIKFRMRSFGGDIENLSSPKYSFQVW